jgi:TM2 domain-containing membrane protein YozV
MTQNGQSEWEHSGKSRKVAMLLAYFVPFGAHQIYLGRRKKGVLIGLFFWAGGSIYCLVQAIHYMIMGEEEFHRRLTMGENEFSEWKQRSKEAEVDEFRVDG